MCIDFNVISLLIRDRAFCLAEVLSERIDWPMS